MGLQERFGVTDVIAFVNPEASHAAKATQQIHAIEQRFGVTVETFESSARMNETRERFHNELVERLGEKTLVLIKGGDGQAHLWAELLEDPETPVEARQTVTLFGANGNKCDTARSLNSHRSLHTPDEVLASPQARVADIYPMQFSYQTPAGEERRTVLSYFGVGASGIGAAAIDIAKPAFREIQDKYPRVGKLIQHALEPAVVLPAGWASPTFTLHEVDKPQHPQETEHVLEWLIRNGTRMAGYKTSNVPLTNRKVCLSTTQTGVSGAWRSANIIGNGLLLAGRKLPAEVFDVSGKPRHWQLADIEGGTLFAQADGEPFVVSEGHVAMQAAPALRAITTVPSTPKHAR
ncbi:MAG TPA: hypothetical protein VJR27_03130 [Candidatus Saccharimonadales bacterium]|nr:hypothetical protein [Candidatus Saccharimonadales bacterium]